MKIQGKGTANTIELLWATLNSNPHDFPTHTNQAKHCRLFVECFNVSIVDALMSLCSYQEHLHILNHLGALIIQSLDALEFILMLSPMILGLMN